MFIKALKEGYAINQPIEFDEAIVRFVNGEELAIVHKTTGKRFNDCENEEFSDGFTLQTMDMWLWSEIVECTQLLVFDQLEAYFKKESATSEDIV
ncbi:hypothetical protein I7X10_09175 [Bacillus halotolerans]|nr:hypothetical protein I7X10_09175 [Bacillus halotolerans]